MGLVPTPAACCDACQHPLQAKLENRLDEAESQCVELRDRAVTQEGACPGQKGNSGCPTEDERGTKGQQRLSLVLRSSSSAARFPEVGVGLTRVVPQY